MEANHGKNTSLACDTDVEKYYFFHVELKFLIINF